MANETNPREEKGKEITKKYDQIKRITEKFYKVQSQTTDYKWYNVVATKFGWECTCADHIYRHVCCKHIHAVEISIKLRQKVLEENTTVIQPVIINSCLFCKSDNIKKFGIRKNKHYDIQRFVCSDCHKTFSENMGFEKLKHNPKGITTAMQLYFSGESLRNVSKSLRLLGMEVTHQTVYNWIKKYTGLMEKYLEKIVPQVGETWRADEIFLKVSGNMKYLYAMMDDETRFWIAKQVADTKYTQDVRPMFEQAKEFAQRKPEVLITDGARNFETAYRKEFRSSRLPTTIHIRHIHMRGDKNNNKMERFNGEVRDREKVMRGLKKMDTPIIDGYKIFHNYIRPSMALDGRTPSQACGIEVEGDNKWITLIQNASIKET
jgi:transposase-like protein